jgi:chromosomal replication initiation ATPase DnaA
VSSPQLPLPFTTEPSRAREDFIVAPCNEEAVRFIDSWPGWPAPSAALHGPSGSGKTHLVHAWAEKSGAAIVDASLFDDRRLHALDPARPVAVENVDLAPAAVRDSALFALLNTGTAVLLTGREHPRDWPVLLPDLASRLKAMLAFALWQPDDALLEGLAKKLFADRQLKVPDAVVARMVVSLERSPSAIRDFVARADAKALAEKRPVTVGLIRELLG